MKQADRNELSKFIQEMNETVSSEVLVVLYNAALKNLYVSAF
jgi:malonyl CoA-acyl carrier protein transacylase